MRAIRLAAIMLQAEQLRFRHVLRRRLTQAALLAVAVALLLVAAGAGEAALYTLLAARLEPAGAAGCLAGGNAALALLLASIALMSTPGITEREAQDVALAARRQIGQIGQSLNAARVVGMLIGRLSRRKQKQSS